MPSPKRQSAHGRDGEILKDNAKGEGKDEVDDPHGEHLLGEKAVPSEPDSDCRHEERQPLGDNVAKRAAGAAMGRAGRNDNNGMACRTLPWAWCACPPPIGAARPWRK